MINANERFQTVVCLTKHANSVGIWVLGRGVEDKPLALEPGIPISIIGSPSLSNETQRNDPSSETVKTKITAGSAFGYFWTQNHKTFNPLGPLQAPRL